MDRSVASRQVNYRTCREEWAFSGHLRYNTAMMRARAAACAAAVSLIAGCASSTSAGSGGYGATSISTPVPALTTSSRGPSADLEPSVPPSDKVRASTLMRQSADFQRVVGNVPYTVTRYLPGTSGTIPDLRMLFVIVRLARPVTIPVGTPVLTYPGEGEPGYGEPVPLEVARQTYQRSDLEASLLSVGIDMDNHRLLSIARFAEPPGR